MDSMCGKGRRVRVRSCLQGGSRICIPSQKPALYAKFEPSLRAVDRFTHGSELRTAKTPIEPFSFDPWMKWKDPPRLCTWPDTGR